MFITHKGKVMKNKRNQKNIIWKILLIIFSIVFIICLIIIGIQKYQQKKQERKQKIKKVYNDMNKKASIGEKMLYNSATRKKAAKYVVNNNMSVSEAKKKAQGEALKNTAAFLAIYKIK